MKPHIRKISSSGPPVCECYSVQGGKGSPKARRFGFGNSIPGAYRSWLSGRVEAGDWA